MAGFNANSEEEAEAAALKKLRARSMSFKETSDYSVAKSGSFGAQEDEGEGLIDCGPGKARKSYEWEILGRGKVMKVHVQGGRTWQGLEKEFNYEAFVRGVCGPQRARGWMVEKINELKATLRKKASECDVGPSGEPECKFTIPTKTSSGVRG